MIANTTHKLMLVCAASASLFISLAEAASAQNTRDTGRVRGFAFVDLGSDTEEQIVDDSLDDIPPLQTEFATEIAESGSRNLSGRSPAESTRDTDRVRGFAFVDLGSDDEEAALTGRADTGNATSIPEPGTVLAIASVSMLMLKLRRRQRISAD